MRKMGLGIALVVSSFAGVASGAPAFRWQGSGSGAAVTFDELSADGCVETVGTLVFQSAPSIGDQGLVLGETIDYCNLDEYGNPTESFFFGGGEVSYDQSGLSSATATGSFTANYYSGTATEPLTFDFALTFTGTGATSTTTSNWISTAGAVTLSFSAQRQRSATTGGSLTINGEEATLSGAQLFSETAGELVILNQ
jgi:hypothetical protein